MQYSCGLQIHIEAPSKSNKKSSQTSYPYLQHFIKDEKLIYCWYLAGEKTTPMIYLMLYSVFTVTDGLRNPHWQQKHEQMDSFVSEGMSFLAILHCSLAHLKQIV